MWTARGVYMYILLLMYILYICTYIYMGDLQVQEVKEEQKNNEHLWTIEKVINDDIFAPEYEPPDEIFNRRKYMLTKKK